MIRRLVVAGVVALALAACDPFGPLTVLTAEQRLASITLSPDSTDVRVGDSVLVTVQLVGKGGGTLSTGTPVFTLGNPLYISVSPTNYVKGLRVGRSELLATLDGKRGSAVFNVIP